MLSRPRFFRFLCLFCVCMCVCIFFPSVLLVFRFFLNYYQFWLFFVVFRFFFRFRFLLVSLLFVRVLLLSRGFGQEAAVKGD